MAKMANFEKTTVFYDGACPLCQKEISFYKRCRGADNVIWIDVRQSEGDEVAPGLSRDQALDRFHVMNEQGQTVSGGEAFACLWAVLPGFQRFSKIFQVRFVLWILNLAYDLFLKIRPLLQTIVRALELNLFSKGFCRRLCGSPSKVSGKTEGD
jgi:predicted DCC family thiol-disulfide oxidoreductase YuxK